MNREQNIKSTPVRNQKHDGIRKIAIALMFVLVTAVSYASDFSAEIGAYPRARLMIENPPSLVYLDYSWLMYSQFSAKIDMISWHGGSVFATGGTKVYFYPISGQVSFWPFFALFSVGGGVSIGPFTLGYEHRCDHAVVPFSYIDDPVLMQDSAYDNIFLRWAATF